jgi:hypothetical protein
MLTKNGGVLLSVPGTPARGRSTWLPIGLHRFLNQILFISPLFWFMELLQNKIYLLALDRYGWGYDPDPQGRLTSWYSFRSLLPWVTTVAVFSLLDTFWFERRRLALPLRMLIAGVIGFAGEWCTGFVSDRMLGHCLQIWPGSPLVYIAFSALPFWFIDYAVFHWLTRELRMARDHRLMNG